MAADSTASTKTARTLLVALMGLNVYRAVTQSITSSEAFTFLHWVHPRIGLIWKGWDANNHVLHTLACKLALTFVRLSEFGLRVPSLVAGGFYFWAVYRLSRRICGDGPALAVSVAALSLNPLVLDYLCEARGYSLALALLMWAIDFLARYFAEAPGEGRASSLNAAGLCAGLSAAASVPFLAPLAALVIATTALSCVRGRREALLVAERFTATACVSAFILLAIPLSHSTAAVFRAGGASLAATVHSVAALSLYHHPFALKLIPEAQVMSWVDGIGPPVWLALGAAAAVAAVVNGRSRSRDGGAAAASLACAAFALTAPILWLSARVFGVAYPLGRCALFVAPMATLAAVAVGVRVPWKPVRLLTLAVFAALGAHYAAELNLSVYAESREDAGGRAAVQAILREAGSRPVRVAATPDLEPIVSFYRERYRLRNWPPVAAPAAAPDAEFRVFRSREAPALPFSLPAHRIYDDGALVVERR
jgi:hypothetical protein